MKDYRSLETAARRVQTTEGILLEFGGAGWIEFIYKERGYLHLKSR